MIPMVRPCFEPNERLLETLREILETGRATNGGPQLKGFEAEAAAYLGTPDAVALASGYSALFLGLRLLDVRGCVVLPAYTFPASLNAVVLNGLEPVFCDVDPCTFTLSPDALARLLRSRADDVGCVMPVNVFGVPPDLDAIGALAGAAAVPLLHDNAHGFGPTRGESPPSGGESGPT